MFSFPIIKDWLLKKLRPLEAFFSADFVTVFARPNPDSLAQALNDLQSFGLDTPQNRIGVTNHHNPVGLVYALKSLQDYEKILQENGPLPPEIRAAVIAHSNPRGLSLAIKFLPVHLLHDPKIRSVVIEHQDPVGLACLLCYLCGASLDTPKIRSAVIEHQDPLLYCFILGAGKIDETLLYEILSYNEFSSIASGLRKARHAITINLLTHEEVDYLLQMLRGFARQGKAIVDGVRNDQSEYTAYSPLLFGTSKAFAGGTSLKLEANGGVAEVMSMRLC